MDYEGNPLDPTGGGSVPTDLTALENKTQNIDVATVADATILNGQLTITKIDAVDTNIITVGVNGTGVAVHVLRPNLCLGQTFIIHTTDLAGIDLSALLIPVIGWDGVIGLSKRCSIFRTTDANNAIYTSDIFRKTDCTITADFFYRYQLPAVWHLDDGSYVQTCMADSNDAYMTRSVPYTFDPILIPVDTNYSMFINGLPTLQGLVQIDTARLDVLYHCSFQYKKALPDTSKLTVADIALTNTASLVTALSQLYDRQPQYGFVNITSNITQDGYINPFYQPISTSWGPAYSTGFTSSALAREQAILHTTTSSQFYIPSDGSYIDYLMPSSPYPGTYKFDIDSALTFVNTTVGTYGFCLDISLLNAAGAILADFDKKFHMVTFRTSNSSLTWSYSDVISVVVTDPLARKIRLQIQSIASNATVTTCETPLTYNISLKHRVQFIN